MIFVMGGAHQGKETFVKKEIVKDVDVLFDYLHTIERNDSLSGTVVIKAVEKSVKTDEDFIKYKKIVEQLCLLESQNKINLILIGEQIGSGIVPVEAADRLWRDNIGFFYQYLTGKASTVYRVWAGLGEKLKG